MTPEQLKNLKKIASKFDKLTGDTLCRICGGYMEDRDMLADHEPGCPLKRYERSKAAKP